MKGSQGFGLPTGSVSREQEAADEPFPQQARRGANAWLDERLLADRVPQPINQGTHCDHGVRLDQQRGFYDLTPWRRAIENSLSIITMDVAEKSPPSAGTASSAASG